MLIRTNISCALLLSCVVLSGCATSRSEVTLESPAAKAPVTSPSNGQIAVIRTVTDERVFEQAPSDPSIPSLGMAGGGQDPAATKARAIGRKRGGFGKALGDVLLENGQTVEGVIRENLTAALRQAGYQVVERTEGTAPLLIDVRIKQFWAWFKPGFWAITLNANITTDLQLSGADLPATITAHAEESGQWAADSDWIEVVAKALTDYRAQVVAKVPTFPKSGGADVHH